ncbi:GMC oxidoreductase family protein [Abortiporus biennis]
MIREPTALYGFWDVYITEPQMLNRSQYLQSPHSLQTTDPVVEVNMSQQGLAVHFSAIDFDYIVVGGGTTGLVVASRLSENPNLTVGVLEAGQPIPSDSLDNVKIPGNFGLNMMNQGIQRVFTTTPQPHLHGRQIWQLRGKVLGGTSVINAMWLTRASKNEYDALASLGNEGWDWDGLLPYFKKSEGLADTTSELAAKYNIHPDQNCHGTEGPLHSSYPLSWTTPLQGPAVEVLKTFGIENNPDGGSGDNIGSFMTPCAIDAQTSTRSYTASAYYEPFKSRTNLHILTGAQVTKILTKTSKNEPVVATGVEFIYDGTIYVASVSIEVVLSAGSFQSPQVLELSGIGNATLLTKLGIDAIIDLPGDHLHIPVVQEIKPGTESLDMLNDPVLRAEQVSRYEKEKTGMLASMTSGVAIVPLQKFATENDTESIKKEIASEEQKAEKKWSKLFHLKQEWLDSDKFGQIELINHPCWLPIGAIGEFAPNPGSRYHTMFVMHLHPFSRGSVHINSTDPLASPVIDPQYFSNSVDLDVLTSGVKFARKVLTTGPLGESHVGFAPGQPKPSASDEEMKEWVRSTTWHPTGTVSMLPRELGGVVDSTLTVYGTANIRVADASILPIALSCHPMATLYAIGEKAADIITAAKHVR